MKTRNERSQWSGLACKWRLCVRVLVLRILSVLHRRNSVQWIVDAIITLDPAQPVSVSPQLHRLVYFSSAHAFACLVVDDACEHLQLNDVEAHLDLVPRASVSSPSCSMSCMEPCLCELGGRGQPPFVAGSSCSPTIALKSPWKLFSDEMPSVFIDALGDPCHEVDIGHVNSKNDNFSQISIVGQRSIEADIDSVPDPLAENDIVLEILRANVPKLLSIVCEGQCCEVLKMGPLVGNDAFSEFEGLGAVRIRAARII